jgi:hypothetical protein
MSHITHYDTFLAASECQRFPCSIDRIRTMTLKMFLTQGTNKCSLRPDVHTFPLSSKPCDQST